MNISIIESQSFNAGHDMDTEWLAALTVMGHTPVILPQTALDNNTFFANTDILIVSSGVIVLPANRITTILQFIQTGKPAYIQSEYLSSMGGNITFASVITSLGGTFSWGANFSGDIQPMNVLGTYGTTNNSVPTLGYFWYSVAGIGDCNLINFLENSGAYHGFHYIPTNPAYGTIISTTDQDWIRATTSTALMENIITHLINPPQPSNGPPINLGNDTTLCTGTILTLDAISPNATYLWNDNSVNSTLNVSQSGTYWVEVSANGCVSTDSIVVNFTSAPVVDLGNDSTLCEGQTVSLNATTPGATYLWQDNTTNSTLNVTQPGTYFVLVTTACGSDIDSVQVNFSPLPVFTLGNDTVLCQGESLILDATTTGGTYLWQDNSTNSDFNVTLSGNYSVTVTVNGCSSVDSVQINFAPLPVINLGSDIALCVGETIVLDATITNATYLWQDNSTNAQLTVTQQGIYWVEVTVNGCSSIDSIQVDFNPIPVFDLGNDQSICQGQSLILDATTLNATYLWQDNTTNATYNVTQSGSYIVEVTVNGCSDTDSVNILVNPAPSINLGNDLFLCDGQTVTLNATTSNATYLWNDNSTNAVYVVTQSGTHWVNVTVNNCSASDTVIVNYTPTPGVNLGNDLTLCDGQSLILDATNTNGVYTWQDNSTSATFTVTQSGTYWVNVSVNNCITTDTIVVNYSPVPVFTLGSDITACESETVVLSALTPNATYLWQDNSTGSGYSTNLTGIYSVVVTVNGCSATDSISIIFNPTPSFELEEVGFACKGEELVIDAYYENATYIWNDGSTSSSIIATQPGNYIVTVTVNSCSAIDGIGVDFINCNVVLEMPNVFTPNHDGKNDTFHPIQMEGITSANLVIIDRWGLEVYTTEDISDGWNGKYKDGNCVDGTFVWIVKYTTVKGEQLNQKGTVMLIK